MTSALSSRVAESELTVVDDLSLTEAKTREVRTILTALGVKRSALIVLSERDEQISRASRNLPEIRAVTTGGLCLLDVLKYRHVVVTRSAAEALTAQLTKAIGRGRKVSGGTESGAAVPMEESAAASAEAGTPSDVAVADAAGEVAAPEADADTKEQA